MFQRLIHRREVKPPVGTWTNVFVEKDSEPCQLDYHLSGKGVNMTWLFDTVNVLMVYVTIVLSESIKFLILLKKN